MGFIDDGTPATGSVANNFTVSYAAIKSTSFSYDDTDSLYYLDQYESRYIDGNDNTQLAFTNVLILRTQITLIPGDLEGRRDVATTGCGSGYFICGGKYIDINWSRTEWSGTDNSPQFTYTLDNGTELFFGRGKTYVCIIADTDEIVFE